MILLALLFFVFLQRGSIAQIPCVPPATALCPESSCCGRNGYCGIGEGYCSIANCLSQCPPAQTLPGTTIPGADYYYYPPPELPVEEAVEPVYHGRHSLAWWLGIIAAVAVVAAGIFAVCWFATRAVSRNRKCECES